MSKPRLGDPQSVVKGLRRHFAMSAVPCVLCQTYALAAADLLDEMRARAETAEAGQRAMAQESLMLRWQVEEQGRTIGSMQAGEVTNAELLSRANLRAKAAEARLAAVIALCKPTTGIDDEGETYVRMPSFTAIRAAATGETP